MMTFAFARNFLGVKGDHAVNKAIEAMVRWDPEAASMADLKTMEQDLDKAGRALARLRSELDGERAAHDKLEAHHSQQMHAAEIINKQIEEASDFLRPPLQKSLETLLADLEQQAPELKQAKDDLEQTKTLTSEAQAVYDEKAAAITQAKASLDRARHELQRANLQEERSRRRADEAAEIAGLHPKSTNSGLTVALDSMHRSADEARQRAEADNMKATALKPKTDVEDENIAKAMAEAAGQATPAKSLSERLAALRQ